MLSERERLRDAYQGGFLKKETFEERTRKGAFEVDPQICPRCQTVEMAIAAWITDRDIVDRIRRHRRERGLASVFERPPARAPPAA